MRKLKKALVGEKLAGRVIADDRHVILNKGDKLEAEQLDELAPPLWGQLRVEDESAQATATAGAAGDDRQRRGDPGALRRQAGPPQGGRRARPRRHQDDQGVRRDEAAAAGRRQDGGTPRQQGRALAHSARGRHAVPGRRNPGRYRAQSAGRAFAHERRTDPGNPSWLRGARAGPPARAGPEDQYDARADEAQAEGSLPR